MSKILIKKIQTQMSDYFSHNSELTKPETRCFKEMTLGILKSKSVFVNQIAASLREPSKLKDVCKRLSAQYLKQDYAEKIRNHHLSTVSSSISKDNFILMDGTDISKKHAKFMEGLEFVKNGDTSEIGLGYNILNINAINAHKEISPLFSKAYSYEMGALSSNNEIKKAVREVMGHIGGKGCWVFDRGADNTILKDFFISQCSEAIIRLKRNTKLVHKGQHVQASTLLDKVDFSINQTVRKMKKTKHVLEGYELGAIQIKTFAGLQSILAVLTTAMYMIYKKTQSLHFNLLLDSGYNYLVKNKVSELTNFIYYKLSKVVSILLMPTKSRWISMNTPPDQSHGQLNLALN